MELRKVAFREVLICLVFSICWMSLLGQPSIFGQVHGSSHGFVKAVYGGIPYYSEGQRELSELGINAVFLHSRSIDSDKVEYVKSRGLKIFAEFNTLHVASYLEEHPDASPVGPDGEVSPAPHGWQGICPTHEAYRDYRMDEFRALLSAFPIDGVWLDYHHSHSSWERAVPSMPDTCFCDRCLDDFEDSTGVRLPSGPTSEKSAVLLDERIQEWVEWRNRVFTDWVREFRTIIDSVRPEVLLGTFHNPWSDDDFDGARLNKLNIDLKAQSEYVDVFSPMPYHARFGHSDDPEWISRQVSWLGQYLGLEGTPEEEIKIWPIVQLSDWGEEVPLSQVKEVLSEGSSAPASGVIVFAWGSLRKQPEKVEEMWEFYRHHR